MGAMIKIQKHMRVEGKELVLAKESLEAVVPMPPPGRYYHEIRELLQRPIVKVQE